MKQHTFSVSDEHKEEKRHVIGKKYEMLLIGKNTIYIIKYNVPEESLLYCHKLQEMLI